MRLIQRARIILLSYERLRNDEIATQVGLNRMQVGLWRRRWKQSFDALVSIECREPQATLRRTIEDVLSDALRAGAHGKSSATPRMLVSLTAIRDQRFDNAPRFNAWYLTFYLFETLDDYRQWCEENLPDWL